MNSFPADGMRVEGHSFNSALPSEYYGRGDAPGPTCARACRMRACRVRMCECMYMHMYMYACMCVCMYTYMCVCPLMVREWRDAP